MARELLNKIHLMPSRARSEAREKMEQSSDATSSPATNESVDNESADSESAMPPVVEKNS